MSGILKPIQDILGRITSIKNAAIPVFYFVRIWNNQLAKISADNQTIENFQMPAAFLEVQAPGPYELVGGGVLTGDLTVRVHVLHNQLDQGDGTMGQDISIFALRDYIVRYVQGYNPTGCGTLILQNEEQDFDHDGLYHYVLTFTCWFEDTTGSPYDANTGIYTPSTPPTIGVVAYTGKAPVQFDLQNLPYKP